MADLSGMNLGRMELENFVTRQDATLEKLKLVVIGLGQAGGKMAQEFHRLGIPSYALNTAESDLDALTIIPDDRKLLLGNIGGASKDISTGRKAILENKQQVGKLLQEDDIKDADVAFITAGLGGGTGNGALPTVINALSKIRAKKNYKGRPTNVAVVSIPGNWEKRGLKKNAVAGISGLNKLIESGKMGATLIIDNEKLAKDFNQYSKNKYNIEMDWDSFGNMNVASTIFEIAIATSLPQTNAFDRSELLDILSTPGFLTLGKQRLTETIYEDSELKNIVRNSFLQSNIFAEGYNFEYDAKIGALIAIRPKNEIIKSDHRTLIEGTMNDILKGAELTHYGLINNSSWGTTHGKDNTRALIYTIAVIESLPKRIIEMIDTINKEEEAIKQSRAKRKTNNIDLSSYLDRFQESETAATSDIHSDTNLFDDVDLFGESDQTDQAKKEDFDPFADDEDL